MNRRLRLILLFLVTLALPIRAAEPQHFVFFNRDRNRISEIWFATNTSFAGAQIKYTWRQLEPRRDEYDFAPIRVDLKTLTAHGKKLFMQLQDSSFDETIVNVPDYLRNTMEFGGGADRQYVIEGDNDQNPKPAGWVAKRWNPAVQKRFHLLLNALGRDFDGRIEGINLPETSIDFGETGRLYPVGFTPEIYRTAVITNMAALKRAFPKSVAMQYANFMPGEWLPEDDKGHLRSVFKKAKELGIGLGGPDLLPYKPGQMKHCYPLLRECAGLVPTGIAVQWGNYEHRNPKTGKRVTVPELIQFARDYLKVDYLIWSLEQPFFDAEVIPVLLKVKKD